MCVTFDWNGSYNDAWNTNHWGRSEAPFYPGDTGSTVNDTVLITIGDSPSSGPSGSLTIAYFTCMNNDFYNTDNLVVTGSLTIGSYRGSEMPRWNGSAANVEAGFYARSGNDSNGVVGDGSGFFDESRNDGTAGDFCYFYDYSRNVYGTVGDYAVFNDYAYPQSAYGTVGNYARFMAPTSGMRATFTGNLYYIGESVAFGYDAKFTHASGQVDFELVNANGQLYQQSYPLTSDGGSTPITFTVRITYQPDLVAGNILAGKTILGVAGSFDEASRNTDPGLTKVLRPADGGPANYKYLGNTYVGTATIPAAANVWYGTGAYGVGGTSRTPTKRASSIANCSAANVRHGVTLDDVSGTLQAGPLRVGAAT